MTLVIVDSGVFIASVLTERFTAQAKLLLSEISHAEGSMQAPVLLHYELVSVLRKSVYTGHISQDQGRLLRTRLLRLPIELHIDLGLLERGYDLAQDLELPRAYDAQYLALAERLGCEFWTTDERLFNSVRSDFPLIRWLGNPEV